MKTPHTITLINSGGLVYDPVTDDYIQDIGEQADYACFANFISQAKVFELYGNRTDKVLIARFMQPPKPFQKAIFKGESFVPIEQTDATKTAYRLKWVSE